MLGREVVFILSHRLKFSRILVETGSLPGLAAVLLVLVVGTIGFTSMLNIPDPVTKAGEEGRIQSALNSFRIIGTIQEMDGTISPNVNSADLPRYGQFVQSIDNFIYEFSDYPVCFAVVLSDPTPGCTTAMPNFTTTIVGQDYRLWGDCNPADGSCVVLAANKHSRDPCERYVDICAETFPTFAPQLNLIIDSGVVRR